MHAYDRRLAARTVLLAAMLALLAVGVVVATDEPYSTTAMRAARVSALSPALASLAVVIALAHARARGELRALAALGSEPLRVARGALVAGWLLGVVATVLLSSPLADVSALFPAVSAPTLWVVEPGALVAPASGISVSKDGVLTLLAIAGGDPVSAGPPRPWAAALAIGPLALVAPIWAASPSPWGFRLLGAGVALALVIFLLHAVAARTVSAAVLAVSAVPLAVSAFVGYSKGPR